MVKRIQEELDSSVKDGSKLLFLWVTLKNS